MIQIIKKSVLELEVRFIKGGIKVVNFVSNASQFLIDKITAGINYVVPQLSNVIVPYIGPVLTSFIINFGLRMIIWLFSSTPKVESIVPNFYEGCPYDSSFQMEKYAYQKNMEYLKQFKVSYFTHTKNKYHDDKNEYLEANGKSWMTHLVEKLNREKEEFLKANNINYKKSNPIYVVQNPINFRITTGLVTKIANPIPLPF